MVNEYNIMENKNNVDVKITFTDVEEGDYTIEYIPYKFLGSDVIYCNKSFNTMSEAEYYEW